jgi:hypothetical protein
MANADLDSLLYNSLVDPLSTICIFADETIGRSSEGDVLRVAAWAIPSSYVQECSPYLREVLRCPLSRRIQSVLEWLSSRMCVGVITALRRTATNKWLAP